MSARWLHAGLAALACAPAAAEPAARCERLLRAVEPGEALRQGDLEPAECGSQAQASSLHHDPLHHVTRARIALAAGDVVPAVAPSTLARYGAGDPVVVSVRVGAVQVQREARVVAPAGERGRVLVQLEGGKTLAAHRAAAQGASQ